MCGSTAQRFWCDCRSLGRGGGLVATCGATGTASPKSPGKDPAQGLDTNKDATPCELLVSHIFFYGWPSLPLLVDTSLPSSSPPVVHR